MLEWYTCWNCNAVYAGRRVYLIPWKDLILRWKWGICCTIWYACSKSFAALENVLEICTLYLNHGSKLRLMSCLQLHCKPWYYRKMQTNEVVIAVAIQLDLSNLYVELQLQWPQFRTMIWIAHVSLGKALW
jgi:hypothetical protein